MRPSRSTLRRLRNSSSAAVLLLAGLVAAAVVLARSLGALTGSELRAYDAFVRLRPVRGRPEPPILLVRIGESEIGRFGHPLPDDVLTRALEILAGARPRAIGVDLYRDRSTGPAAVALAKRVRQDSRIVVVEKLADATTPAVAAPPFVEDPTQVGFSDLVVDDDGVVRRGLLYLWDDRDRPHLSFSLRLALRHLEPEGATLQPDPARPGGVSLGGEPIPPLAPSDGAYVAADTGGYQFLLDYRRAPRSFATVSFADLIDGRVAAEAVRDRVVILGTASPSVKDHFLTPQDSHWVYGLEIHAHALDQLVRVARGHDPPLRPVAEGLEAGWILVWALLGAGVGVRLRSPLGLGACGGGGLAGVAGLGYASFLADRWLPSVAPGIAWLGAGGLAVAWASMRERAEKAAVMRLFGRFVSRRVAERIWEQREEFLEAGRPRPQRLVSSVLMADLRGYTSAAEKLEPGVLLEWINGFMEAMAEIVEAHGGMVDDYAGDGIKANFGVPATRRSQDEIVGDARAAVRCALHMGRALAALNAAWRARGLPPGRMRVGIFTGPVVVGTLGSANRLKYTTVGDTVNTASRLESFDKQAFEGDSASYRVLVGESTRRLLGDDFRTVCVGSHLLAGKTDRLTVYRVLDPEESPDGGGGSGPS